jgi:hypothetical protein
MSGADCIQAMFYAICFTQVSSGMHLLAILAASKGQKKLIREKHGFAFIKIFSSLSNGMVGILRFFLIGQNFNKNQCKPHTWGK